ncbi:hypothetical protein IVB45_22985 [Bradyrhizobium sp. 4]|uniref:hypothetical protein n=1 Tax=unclassified Bradyrhizobium TaxID=2631580 RepID=UPI001FFAF833|nr:MULTISPECIES: hypothetical protein [unclassified Bradyrhizobium]MCK1402764.1 hypothetical protein [Bradyrhizobium sp. 39]MCK1748359.1 hypothetical protein [Bradyrhizobium sp. 135]UPJ32832.1 hypothetical protein IVB45_22985 [Bradyrhizobium sp. 4]
MRDDLKKEFEKAITDKNRRDEEQHITAERKRTEAEQFQADWVDKISTVVRPALQEVVDQLLSPAGWQTRFVDTPPAAGLEVYKGNMTTAGGGRTRPNITFAPTPSGNKITVYIATPNLGQSTASLTVDEVTHDKIQEEALGFFKKLTST